MATNKNLYTQIGNTFAELSELFNQLSAEGTTETPVKETATKAKETAPVEEAEESEVEYTQDGLNSMSLAELKALADDNEIEYTKSVKKQPLIQIILDAMTESEEEEEEEVADVSEDVEEDVAEEEEEEEEEESDTIIEDEDGNEIDLNTMSFGKLKKLAEEYDIELEAKNKAGAIEEILAFMTEDDDEEEEADEEEVESDEEGEEEEIDLDEMDLDELKELAEEMEVELPKKKKVQKADAYLQIVRDTLEEALSEEDEEEEEDGEEEEDLAETLGLNDMSTEELAEMLEEYELSTKGKKQALIARIIKAVEDGTIEVEEEEEGE